LSVKAIYLLNCKNW